MLRLEVTLSQAWLVSSSPPDGPEEITAAALTGEGLTARPRTRERGPARGVERGGSVWGGGGWRKGEGSGTEGGGSFKQGGMRDG